MARLKCHFFWMMFYVVLYVVTWARKILFEIFWIVFFVNNYFSANKNKKNKVIFLNKHWSHCWWSRNGVCWGRPIATIAVRILSSPTSSALSAACERSCSTYANVHTAKRNRLTTTRASKLVYISQNLELFYVSSCSQAFLSHSHSTIVICDYIEL